MDLRLDIIGEINKELAQDILTQISSLEMIEKEREEKIENLIVNITSEGGILHYGLAIYDELKLLPYNIITRARGLCASAGFLIFLAGDERVVLENTEVLYHQISFGLGVEFIESQRKEIKNRDKISKRVMELVSLETRIPMKKLKGVQLYDWTFSKDELIKYEIADKIIETHSARARFVYE